MALSIALSLILAFSVLAFGAVEGWASATVEAALFALAGWALWRDREALRPPTRLFVPALLAGSLALVAALQLVPLPLSAWASLGDERATVQKEAVDAEGLLRSEAYRTEPITGQVLPEDRDPLLTPAPSSTLSATFTPLQTARALLALLAALAFVLLLDRAAGDGRDPLRLLSLAAGILGLGVGLVALVQFRPGASKILGLRESAHAGGAFGSFINENNGMGFVNVAFCLLYFLLWRKARNHKRLTNRVGVAVFALGLAGFHAALLLMRTSGAGLWTALLLPVAFGLAALRKRPAVLAAACVLLAAVLAAGSFVALHYRFTDLHGRVGIWQNALGQDHWAVGNGLGAFADRFPSVTTDLPTRSAVLWLYPENEYLQLYFEAGVPGLLVGLLALVFVALLGYHALAAGGGTFLLVPALWGEALHAFTDFHFHLWPVVMAYLILVAVTARAIESQARKRP
jgi:hypothetical protein